MTTPNQRPGDEELEKILKDFLMLHAKKLWNLRPADIDLSKALKAIKHRETEAERLLAEYFDLKERDKSIRQIRNEYMASHHCLVADKDNSDECIHRTVGMGGYPAPLCPVCEKRNAWYTERQKLSHRRSVIMRKLNQLTPKELTDEGESL